MRHFGNSGVGNMVAVSIISPVYKAESYLARCLDSVLAQTFKDWELILVDDGSPDRSGAICDEYAAKDGRIKVIHKANGGVSAARQDGLDAATGEYVIHVDPDDWIVPDMLQALYEKAVAEAADMVICDYSEDVDDNRKVVVQKPSSLDANIVFKELFYSLHGSCGNKLVRRSLFDRFGIRFPKGYTILEDLYVSAMLCSHDIKIAYLPKAFYHYVQDVNPCGLGRKYNRMSVASIMSFCRAFEPLWHARGFSYEEYFYKYATKSFAYDSGEYTRSEIRKLYPEINRRLLLDAIHNIFRKPWILEVCLGQYLPRFMGHCCCGLICRAIRILSK